MEDVKKILSADKPVSDPQADRLGYALFARHLADSLGYMAPTEGFVVAIYGSWGAGKTTVLQFVDHYVQQKPKDEQPITLHFNPWWFSGHEDLTRRFFDQLLAALAGKAVSAGKKLRETIADFADLLSDIPIPYAEVGKAVSQAARPKVKDVPELKNRIAALLREQKKRILVIIDDIDRLTAEEIRQLFRVIKAVADFPNIIYLLAFDKQVAIQALEATQGIPGDAYLEKIIQMPFELPLPDRNKLDSLLLQRLDIILRETPAELFDPNYWSNVYYEGVRNFIETPRDVVRLVNVLAVTYPSVQGEVNPVDFIAIEALRVFYPALYDSIQKNPASFACHAETMTSSVSGDLRPWYDALVSQYLSEQQNILKKLLFRLFPRVATLWGGSIYGSAWDGEWRKLRLVRSPDILPIYFHLAVPNDDISRAEMQAFLAVTGDVEAFGAKLRELALQKRSDGRMRTGVLLTHLQDYTGHEISLEQIPTVLFALFQVGDTLLSAEEPQGGMFEFGNDVLLGRVVWQLLQRLDQVKRFSVVKDAMTNGYAISTIVMEVEVFGQQHGKYGSKTKDPEQEWLLSEAQLHELEVTALNKLRSAAQDGMLLTAPLLPNLLYRYRDWAGDAEVKHWVGETMQSESKLLVFLEQFLRQSFSWTYSDTSARIRYRLDPQWLEPFIDPSLIVQRVKNLNTDGLPEKQRLAFIQLLHEYELRQQGKNPDDPMVS